MAPDTHLQATEMLPNVQCPHNKERLGVWESFLWICQISGRNDSRSNYLPLLKVKGGSHYMLSLVVSPSLDATLLLKPF